MNEPASPFQTIGKSEIRPEAEMKVRGDGIYTTHVEIPDMVHARALRSPYPHARILSVDASKAENLPGVVCAFTRDDLGPYFPTFGPVYYDQPIICFDKVRFVGDPVAAVVAEDEDILDEALELIEVEYEGLPAVTNVLDALKEDAPLVHETMELPPIGFADLKTVRPVPGTNICNHFILRNGDVEEGFGKSDLVIEETYSTPTTQHVTFEPFITIARQEADGRMHIWTSNQNPFLARQETAHCLKVPVGDVRVEVTYVGGGYGSKTYARLEPLVSCLAIKSRRPVRMMLSREETFLTCVKHASVVTVKTGVMKDGRLVARQMTNRMDTGAYADIGPRVTKNSGYVSCGPYKWEHVRVDAYCVLTNKPSAGPFRGFGVAQVSWAYENQMDRLAEELGLDPYEFRMMNLLDDGDTFATGSKMHAVGFKESLRKAAEAIQWASPAAPARNPKVKVGKGLSVTIKSTATPTTSSAYMKLNDDGSVNVVASAVDMGQGSNTVMAQIAAETLGVRYDEVIVTHQDTDYTPYDQMTNSSRSTFHVGGAVQKASMAIREQVIAIAAEQLEADPGELRTGGGKIWVEGAPDRSLTFREAVQGYFRMNGGDLLGTGLYKVEGGKLNFDTGQAEGELTAVFWFVGAGAAEVEVDTETGQVRVRKLINSIDVGKALNPLRCEEQIAGSSMMAYGQTLYESLNFDNGQPINPNLSDYVLPSFEEIPAVMENIIIETPHKDGPFGAKGTGETSITPTGPAIANAIYDAIGVRIHDLPITPEKVLRALKEKEGGNSK